jgi:hypothetical protein
MGGKANALSEKIRVFNQEVISFVEGCSDENWQKTCAEEQWPVGVTARHIGAGHYAALDLVKMIVGGEPLPETTVEQLVEMGNAHARKHSQCTRSEVLDILKRNGSRLEAYVAQLPDEALDKKGHLTLAGGEVSAEMLLDLVVLQSGGQHFQSMKKAAA